MTRKGHKKYVKGRTGDVRRGQNVASQSTSNQRREALTTLVNQRTGGYIGREVKFADYVLNFANCPLPTVAGVWFNNQINNTLLVLNSLQQGSGPNERIGREVSMLKMHIQGTIYYAPRVIPMAPGAGAGLNTSFAVRIAVIMDNQWNGGDPSMGAIDPSLIYNTAVNEDATTTYRNLQWTKRFTILKDEVFNILSTAAPGTNTQNNELFVPAMQRHFSMNIDFRKFNNGNPIRVTYAGPTVNATEIADCAIFMLVSYPFSRFDNDAVCVPFQSRLRFVG
jgi:hypothetical protein